MTPNILCKMHVNLHPWLFRPPGQCDLLVFAAPAGGLHLCELQQQLPVAPISIASCGGFLRSLPVQDVEPGGVAALRPTQPRSTATEAADQQQLATPDPPQLGTTEIRGLSR